MPESLPTCNPNYSGGRGRKTTVQDMAKVSETLSEKQAKSKQD
jgi:hypothetical protein